MLESGRAPALKFRGSIRVSDRTITRAELVDSMIREVGLSRADCARFLSDLLTLIEERVVAGDPVKIARFGNFSVRDKRERVGRNPKTGEEAAISARRVVTFKASSLLKDMANHSEPGQSL